MSGGRRLAAQLLLERLRLALQLTVGAHPVGAGAPQRGRGGVDGDRGPRAGVEDAMDRHRRHGECRPGSHLPGLRRPGEPEAVLAYAAGDDGDRGAGLVVVVEPGVLVPAPADDPGVDV